MKQTLQQRPFFLLLLPLFFVWHGFVANFHFVPISDCLPLIAIYCVAAILTGFFAWLILKNILKAALLASFIMAFYLFFGYFHDLLRKHNIFLHKYTLLLPVFLIVLVLLTIYLKKATRFTRACYFLNLLLLIYLVVDAGVLVWKAAGHNRSGYTIGAFSPGRYKTCDTCSRPDIYFLLFDGYSSSRILKDLYHYDDSALDRYLESEGFHIQYGSRSELFQDALFDGIHTEFLLSEWGSRIHRILRPTIIPICSKSSGTARSLNSFLHGVMRSSIIPLSIFRVLPHRWINPLFRRRPN